MKEILPEAGNKAEAGLSLPAPKNIQDELRSNANHLLMKPQWRMHNAEEIEEEKGELKRTADELQLNYKQLEAAFYAGQLSELSDADWLNLENAHSNKPSWTKEEVIAEIGDTRDHATIFRGLEQGEELPVPIVLFREGMKPYLIGGNTRLLACRALGIRPMILAVRI